MASQMEKVTAAIKIELFRQWQTHDNGVHMTLETFGSIDFEALSERALDAIGS